MSRLDAFEESKENLRTANLAWIRELPIVSYGHVTEVIDVNTVIVEPVIQYSVEHAQEYTVSLLSLSSALFELSVTPSVGDLVMLLSLNRYHPQMFDDVDTREEAVIEDDVENGYTIYSQVGILLRTVRSASLLSASIDDHELSANVGVDMAVRCTKDVNVSLESESADMKQVTLSIDELHKLAMQINSANLMELGIKDVSDNKREEVPVSTKVVAHGKAPLELDIRSSVTALFGIGNDENEDDSEQRKPTLEVQVSDGFNIDAELGTDGKVSVTMGDSDVSTKTDGDVKHETGDYDIKAQKPVGINDGLYKAAMKAYIADTKSAAQDLMTDFLNPLLLVQLTIADALTGGMGQVVQMPTHISKFCTKIISASAKLDADIKKVVK